MCTPLYTAASMDVSSMCALLDSILPLHFCFDSILPLRVCSTHLLIDPGNIACRARGQTSTHNQSLPAMMQCISLIMKCHSTCLVQSMQPPGLVCHSVKGLTALAHMFMNILSASALENGLLLQAATYR